MTRLAYLLKKFPRLSETFVLNEILRQEELGRQLTIFSRRTPDNEPRHPQIASLQSRVEVLPPPAELDPWRELFVEGEVGVPDLERVGDLVRSMQQFDRARLPRLMAEAFFLLRRTRDLGVDHLHVHFATESAVTAHLLRELGGPTYSITAHAKDIYRSTVDPALLSRIIEGSEFTVTVCDANVRHLESLLSTAAYEKVRRLYNGVDLDLFTSSDTDRQTAEILAVGRLVPKKGFDVLIEAFALLAERHVPFHGTIMGEGDEAPFLAARLKEHGLERHVDLTGPATQDDVRRHMERATVFCLPCVQSDDGNRDALPTVLLEALASGLPVVSTPVTGIPEILDAGRAGMLVPERDAVATADALGAMLGEPHRRAQFSRIGREHAEANFDARQVARTLHAWFDDALNQVPQR